MSKAVACCWSQAFSVDAGAYPGEHTIMSICFIDVVKGVPWISAGGEMYLHSHRKFVCRFKREMTRHYQLGPLIGAGTFGKVHEATCRRTGREFAVKTIHKRFEGQFLERHFVARVHHEV